MRPGNGTRVDNSLRLRWMVETRRETGRVRRFATGITKRASRGVIAA